MQQTIWSKLSIGIVSYGSFDFGSANIHHFCHMSLTHQRQIQEMNPGNAQLKAFKAEE